MKSPDFIKKKQLGEKITMLTCYDYPSARLAATTPIHCLLVGDSVAMTVHGYPSTVHATLDMMVTHTQAVSRGLGPQFLISDLPFLTYQASFSQTLRHVQKIMQAGAHAIKLEGGSASHCQTVYRLTQAGVAVIGHLGLLPQSVHQIGGYRLQGKDPEQASRLLAEAQALEQAGCLAIVLECIPASLTLAISQALSIPTIGIGAGPHADGQVLVWHDMLDLDLEKRPKFVKQFASCASNIQDAITQYHLQVTTQRFPLLAPSP